MAITYIAAGTAAEGNNANISPGLPAGHTTGDVLLCLVAFRSVGTITVPGYTQLAVKDGAGAQILYLFGKVDGGGESAPTVTVSGGSANNSVIARMYCIRGALADMDNIVAHSATTDSTSDQTVEYPALTITTPNCFVLIGYSQSDNNTSDDTPAGFTDTGFFFTNLGSQICGNAKYQIQTTATDTSSGTITVSGASNAISESLVVALKPAAVAPAFDSSPTVSSQTASTYTIGYDADANAANIYVGAYLKGATAPTASQLKAGTGAHGTATEATTGSNDSIDLTPSESTKFPIYDVYAVLEGAGGFSTVVAMVDEMLDPPAGKQFITLASVSSTSPLTGASPTVVAGDIWVTDAVTTPSSYVLTLYDTGDYSIAAGGDTSRQSFAHDVYDVSLGAYYGAGTVIDGNLPPYRIAGGLGGLLDGAIYKKGQNQGTIALADFMADPEGDSFTFALHSGALPTGWSLASNGNITGTPTTYGTYNWVLRITDTVGDYIDITDSAVIGDEMPDVVDEVEATAITDVEAVANFTVTLPVSTAYSDTIVLGNVISQDPTAGEYVADDTTVTLTVSLGEAPTSFARPQIRIGIGLP